VGTSVRDKSMLCGGRPGASAQRGRLRGVSPAREAAATLCIPWWNRKDNFCPRVSVCTHLRAGHGEAPQGCRSVAKERVCMVSGAHAEGCTSLAGPAHTRWEHVGTECGVPRSQDEL